jgi:site-specific recombinase XerD
LSHREVPRLLDAPDLDRNQRLVLRTLYASGMRVEELVAMTRPALEPETGSIRLADRQVLVDAATFSYLLELDWSQWSWTVETVSETLERAARSCDVWERFQAMERTLLPKVLRNAYSAHCLEYGMDLFSLHDLLGHDYIDTTEMVIGLAVGQWREAYDLCHPLARAQPTPADREEALGVASQVRGLRANELHELLAGDLAEEELRGGGEQANLLESEVRAMLEAGVKRNPELALFLRIIYAGGLRINEIAVPDKPKPKKPKTREGSEEPGSQLLFADFEFEEGRLFLRQAKESKDRYTLIDHTTAGLIRDFQKDKGLAAPICTELDSKLRRFITKLAKDTGLDKKYDAQSLSPHSFRHAHATHLYQHGMDVSTIKRLLGHAKLEDTAIYVKSDMPQWRAAYDSCPLLK